MNGVLMLAVPLLALVMASAQAGQAGAPVVWVVSDMERVGKTDAPKRARDIELYAARGECAAFQVVVRAPRGGLTGVSLQVSDLTGRRGNKIPASQVARYREHYLHTRGTAHWEDRSVPLGPGWYADALIPFIDPATGQPPAEAPYKAAPAAVAAEENQPYWIDIPVPRDLAPGRYTGRYVVTSDQGSARGRITLNVWGFTLPLKPAARSLFLIWDSDRDNLEVHKELLRHRMMPLQTPIAHAAELMREYGLNIGGARFWSGADVSSGRFGPAPTVEQCVKEAGLYPKDLPLVAYTADEITGHTEWYDRIKEWARSLHQAGIKQLITVPADPALFDDGSGTGKPAVDIWVMLGCFYEQGTYWRDTQEAIRRGMEAWSYTCLNQDGYSPKWTLDFPPIHFRAMQGFMNQSMGFTGTLYWAVDRWANRNPWVDPSDGTGNYPGDGALAYPGAPAGLKGIAPSLRMKWIRKGFEDYEYVELLKQVGQKELALRLARQAATDFKHWSQDPAVYERVRRQIAQALSRRPGEANAGTGERQ